MEMDFMSKIEYLRRKMAAVALEKGFTSCESVALSQELDKLLNMYSDAEFGLNNDYTREYKLP